MPLIEFTRVQAYLGARILFTVDAARLEPRRRVALIGPNGVGKSTFLRAIAASHGAPAAAMPQTPVALRGAITFVRGLSLGSLPQEVPADGPPPAPSVRTAWCIPDLPVAALSGGLRTRAALGAVLAADPDVLLLDEPTNHLDVVGLELLERALRTYQGAALLVSHDRVFLDRVATEVWELDRHWTAQEEAGQGRAADRGATLRVFPGNYSAYRRQTALTQETERRAFADFERKRDHLRTAVQRQREWTAKAFAAAGVRDPNAQRLAKKAAKKGKAYERRLARDLGAAPPKPWERDRVAMPTAGSAFHGAWLATADGLGIGPLGPGGPVVVRSVRFNLASRARVALIGPNGGGKTTLLRTLAAEVAPCEGHFWRSPAVRTAFVQQGRDELPGAATAIEAIAAADVGPNDASDSRHHNGPHSPTARIRSVCAALGLRGERATAPVAALSGGERTALALARALLSGANLLLLDEPTNHLDLWMREAVEAALTEYPGAVVLATHDRWLLEHWAEDVWHVAAGRLSTARRAPPAVEEDTPVGGTGAATGRLATQMRLAELTAQLANPRVANTPARRAGIEREIERLVQEARLREDGRP